MQEDYLPTDPGQTTYPSQTRIKIALGKTESHSRSPLAGPALHNDHFCFSSALYSWLWIQLWSSGDILLIVAQRGRECES